MRYLTKYMLMGVLLLCSLSLVAQTTKWRDMYKVKKKDTLFGIAREYGITLPELMEANPDMKIEGYQLKKGDYIFIPYAKPGAAKPAVTAQPASAEQKTVRTVGQTIRIGVMLPLHQVDGDGRRMVEYYRGVLMACDRMKAEGISTDVHAWNVPIDADIRTALLDDAAAKCDVIFGPLYTKQVKPLADFCRKHDIKLVIPFSINGNEVASNARVFQVYQSAGNLNDDAIKAYLERFPRHHAVFVDCNDTTSKKGAFTFGLRKQLEQRGLKYNITNLKSSEESFAKSFSRTEPNVVILNTGRSPELSVALAKLDGLTTRYPGIVISLYGYTEWLMYVDYQLAHFYKYDTYIPSTFYYNPLDAATKALEKDYGRWFKTDMQRSLPRFAITGYDHASYFVHGLKLHHKNFVGSASQSTYRPLQNRLYFRRVGNDGGYQNANFQLIHYTGQQTIESINY